MKVKHVLKRYPTRQPGQPREADCRSWTALVDHVAVVRGASVFQLQASGAALLLLFTGSCVLVGRFANDPARLGALFTITGASMVALIGWMFSLWKEKVTADLVGMLIQELEPDDVRAVVEVLAGKL